MIVPLLSVFDPHRAVLSAQSAKSTNVLSDTLFSFRYNFRKGEKEHLPDNIDIAGLCGLCGQNGHGEPSHGLRGRNVIMNDPFEYVPDYVSPLTDAQHACVGRIAILWGQIEWYVDALIPRVSGLSDDQLKALGLTSKQVGTKVDFLKASSKVHSDPIVAASVSAIYDAIVETKADRNHVFHGFWGWRADDRTQTVFPAARKEGVQHNPFRASDLPSLEKQLCRCSRLCANLMREIDGEEPRSKYSRFYHGKTAFPKWFVQWLERNPLDCEALDRTATKGQLPHLETPYPQR